MAAIPHRHREDLQGSPAHDSHTRRLSVAMLIHRFYPHVGGAETQLQALIPHLQANGVDVHVVTRQDPGTSPRERIHGANIRRTDVPGPRVTASLSYTLQSIQYLTQRRRSIDVLHAHGLLSPTTTALLAKLALRLPLVVTVHGFQADLALLRSGFLGVERLRAFARWVDRFVVISNEIGEGLKEVGVSSAKLTEIPNGIDVERFRPASPDGKIAARRALGVGNAPIVLYVGRLEPVKGPGHLLDAWAQVRQAIPSAELLLVGQGSERAMLEARAEAGVRFVGAQYDPLPYYHAADCFVLPSHSEGLPVALLEALATQLPVVSTAVGGAREILLGHEEQCLVPSGDVRALSAALVRRLSAPAHTGEAAALRDRIERDFSIHQTARRLANLYAELAGREPGE